MSRKLLTAEAAAEKLSMSIDTFYRDRPLLYKDGFPRPIMGDGKWGRAKYDSGAIDAWFDSKMDPALRAGETHIQDGGTDWGKILEQRLEAGA